MKLLLAAASITAVFFSTPASAGWQWSQWGMTPSQVEASAPAKIGAYHDAKLDSGSLQSELVTTHQADGFKFSVAMLFDRQTDRLAQVRLLLSDQDGTGCSALTGSLRKLYGQPESAAPLGFRRWRDPASGNLISLQPLGGCWLVYEPIPTSGASGL